MDKNLLIKKIFEVAKYSDDPIIILDENNSIYFTNFSFLHLLNKETAKNKNITLSEINHFLIENATNKKIALKVSEYLESPSKEKQKKELTFKFGEDIKSYEIEISSLIENGNIIGTLAVFKDITGYKKLINLLSDQSIKDFLTGIYNQRYFYHSLYKEIKRYKRYKNPLSLLMIDIDNFKKFNDTYGHLKGDWLLRVTAKILNESIRDGIDYAARYGGDEFVIILVDANRKKAAEVAERIIQKYKKIDTRSTSLSIGICQYREDMSANSLIKIADSAMYEAKKSGNNLVLKN